MESKEKRAAFVVIFSAVTMVAEIATGLLSGSMALLADGIHMGSHVLAIGLSWAAYACVRHLSGKPDLRIDPDKIPLLAAYTSGILLLVFALFILAEAAERLFLADVTIRHGEAMAVAVTGLVVNVVCALALHGKEHDGDLNRRSAYLHVLADALTSVGAIFGLLCARVWGITWIDTAVSVVMSAVIIRWAKGLLLETGKRLVI